jgi:PAS domain S-box-containing protein
MIVMLISHGFQMDKTIRVRKISIHRVFFICLALVGGLSVFAIGYLWVAAELSRFKDEANTLRVSYLEGRKEVLKREASQALSFIKYMQSQTEYRLRESIKNRVNEAYSIAENIYQKQKDTNSIEEIQTTIKEALRPIRFNKDRGYYFAFTMDGIETLFAAKPEMEGKNMLRVKGGKGEFVVSDMLGIIQKKGEGFYKYTWPKPGSEGYFPKIAFVKLFEPIGWVIGTGEYINDVEKDIQEECINWISNIRFGKDGYVFVGQWDGLSLSGPAASKNMYDVEDLNGVKIVQELIEAAKAGGGFVHYVLPKFEGKRHSPKLSYAIGVPEWEWYLGSGVYVNEIEDAIDLKQAKLNKRIRVNILNILFVIVALISFIFIIVKLLSNRIRDNLSSFKRFFDLAASENIQIKQHELHFSEFFQLAVSANDMLENRKRAEKSLRASEKRFRDLSELLPEVIFEADKDMNLTFVNRHAYSMFGYSKQDFEKGLNGFDMIAPEDRKRARENITKRFQGEAFGAHEYRGLRKDGSIIPVLFHTALIVIKGTVAGFRGIVVDITDRKKIEEHLLQDQKMKSMGTLAGGIAHDFNNILAGIIGYTELSRMSVPEESRISGYLDNIMTAGSRAKDLVRQILTFSRQTDQELKPVSVKVIIIEALKLLRASLPSTIEIRQNIKSDSLVMGDPTQIHQIIMNLCTNAGQAMQETGGTLTVDLIDIELDRVAAAHYPDLEPRPYINLTVSDTGHGMPPDVLDQIFDPFFTTKEQGQGTGMGLAVVHGILKSYGGAIYAQSELNKGSIFDVFLPPIESNLKPDKGTQEVLPKGTEHILYVDDEPALVDIGKKMLESLGYQVVTRTSSIEALGFFRAQPDRFDLVITDMTMPQITGDKLSEKLIAIRKDIPIILCTGFSYRITEEEINTIGIKGLLMKPIIRTDLAQMVRQVLDEAIGSTQA